MEAEVEAGESMRSVAHRYGLGETSVRRHRRDHRNPGLVAVTGEVVSAPAERGPTARERIEKILAQAELLLDAARAAGNGVQAIAAIRELRAAVELLARLNGELNEKPTTVINVAALGQWVEIRTSIFQTLAPWPDARLAVAEALGRLAA